MSSTEKTNELDLELLTKIFTEMNEEEFKSSPKAAEDLQCLYDKKVILKLLDVIAQLIDQNTKKDILIEKLNLKIKKG